MRIKPIMFNYGKLEDDMPGTKVTYNRKNVVLENDKYTLWGELLSKDDRQMMLTSIAVSRGYTKETKQDVVDERENYLHQYAENDPDEILERIEKRKKKEEEKARKEAEAKAASNTNAPSTPTNTDGKGKTKVG